jgi:hypothetical protein
MFEEIALLTVIDGSGRRAVVEDPLLMRITVKFNDAKTEVMID